MTSGSMTVVRSCYREKDVKCSLTVMFTYQEILLSEEDVISLLRHDLKKKQYSFSCLKSWDIRKNSLQSQRGSFFTPKIYNCKKRTYFKTS